MDPRARRLQQVVGRLAVPDGSREDELVRFRRVLARHLSVHPDLTIRGNQVRHAAEPGDELSAAQLAEFESLVRTPAAESSAAAPLIFRRETPFRSNLLGNSVPSWASGVAPAETFGPFVDEHGLRVWFDLYLPARLVSFSFAGGAAPVLRATVRRTLIGTQSYRLAAGSLWIASDVIARVAALQGHYTGLQIRGGSIELSQPATVSNGAVILSPATTVKVHLDLRQKTVPAGPHDAGADAVDATVRLPETLDLTFQLQSSTVVAGDASCTVFGCDVDFKRTGQPPQQIASTPNILVPFAATTRTNAPDQFEVVSSQSALCDLAGRAPIDAAGTGWVLPATKADPLTLGEAAGTGALGIAMSKGLTATWKGLKGNRTVLLHPGIIVEPGLVTTLDFTASNPEGRQRWTLWRNAATRHHSHVSLSFGKQFPLVFVSSAANSEGVFCFCSHKADIDRPVDANGRPFAIRSPIALAATLQTGATFQALLYDNDLLEEETLSKKPRQYSIALRNALFHVGSPRSLALFGTLDGERLVNGTLALTHAIGLYLPTLPDPYVASYTPYLRDAAAFGFGRLQQELTGFVKWPDPSPPADDDTEDSTAAAFVFYRLSTPPPPAAIASSSRDFQSGVISFDRELARHTLDTTAIAPMAAARPVSTAAGDTARARVPVDQQVATAVRSGALARAVDELERSPLLRQFADRRDRITRALDLNLAAQRQQRDSDRFASTTASTLSLGRILEDPLMLLDVSSRADQMGVSIGPALRVDHDARGNAIVRGADSSMPSQAGAGLPLQISNMDVVATAQNVRAATLPQISWEPVWNIPLAIEGGPDPGDTVTVTPGPVVYENDGLATRIFSESPDQVPVAPLPVTRHFLKAFNDEQTPRPLRSIFNLPFGMLGQADFNRKIAQPDEQNARLRFNMPYFGALRGGLQVKALAPASPAPELYGPCFPGWTLQLDNIRWALFGTKLTGSTLGKTVLEIFNQKFTKDFRRVPVEKMEFSGYGASIFSNWLNNGTIADVSQVQFDVIVGRTAHEVVQVRSILYPFGVHVVRTITLTRSNNGYVFRSDSGWKAESDGFYEFGYTLDLIDETVSPPTHDKVAVPNPYEFHEQPVKGVSNVREIRDFPDAGSFKSSFRLDDPDLPQALKDMKDGDWKKVFESATGKSYELDVHLQAVVFDADVHLDNVVSGGQWAGSDFVVQSRKMLGYVQLAPSKILIPDRLFADLLNFQKGSLGGPVDCIVNVAKTEQRMRLSRVDVNPAKNAAGKHAFVTAARGSLVLPPDGAWSVVKQHTNTGDVQPLAPQELVPLIKPNGNPNYLVAHPADVEVPASNTRYGVLQSTGTQKLLFDVPQFAPGTPKLISAQTYFADAYKLLNSKGVFPNIANALGLTAAEREVKILGEGLMEMAERTLNLETLLPDSYTYAFVDEPGVLRIYAQYKTKGDDKGRLALGIDSAGALADRWKAALSNMRVVVDLGPFDELMWVNGNFNAGSGISTKFDKPHLEFGEALEPVVKILRILASLSGEDFDRGMNVGMSNSPENWEYKFDCSKEIPVIRFPSPLQLTLNPNPPLKLEAGLKVGFYFNQMLAIPTDLKQLVPAAGAYVQFYGRLQVQCFTLAVASVYAVGQVTLGIAADSKAGISLHMKFGFGAEVVVGLPVVANVAVLYMVEVEVDIADDKLHVAGLLLFRGSAEILGGLVGICIQIEAGGSVDRSNDETTLTAQVTFSIDVCVLWVIDIEVTEHWEEQRQIA